VHTVSITTGTHTRAVVASGVEDSEHSESSTRLSVRLSLSLNGTSRDAPAKDRRERISTVDPCCQCGRALVSKFGSTSSEKSAP
jgi:hypothetical protein